MALEWQLIIKGNLGWSHHFQRNYNGMKQEPFYIQNLDRWETSFPNQQATRHHIVHLNRLNLSIMSRHWATSSFQWASAEKTSNLRHPHEEQKQQIGGNEKSPHSYNNRPTAWCRPLLDPSDKPHPTGRAISPIRLDRGLLDHSQHATNPRKKVTARVLNTLVGGKSKGTCDMVHD